MNDLILLILSSAAMTYSIQNLISQVKKNGLASLLLNPFITITLLVWCQAFLLLCIADNTVKIIAEHQSSQLLMMYGVMYVMVFIKIQMDKRKLSQANKHTQEVTNV